MKHYPAEIANKTFDRKMMGFDIDQVKDYLIVVAAQLEALIIEKKTLSEELRDKNLQLLEHKDREQVLKNAITQTTEITEKMRTETDRECQLIINDAHQKAEIITQDAKDSLRKIYQEVSDLKKSKMQFEANLKAMAQAHLSLLEQTESYMPKMRMNHFDLE